MPGAWTNNDTNSLTLPPGATTGTARIVIGSDIPASLIAFYSTATVVSAEIFYSTNDATYMYIAYVIFGPTDSNIVIGESEQGVLQERMFIGGLLHGFIWANAIKYEDTNGNTTNGGWKSIATVVGYLNGWGDLGGTFVLGQYRLIASPAYSMQIVGVLTTGVKAIGTVICTLPAAFRPAHRTRIEVSASASPAVGASTPSLDLLQSGDLVVSGTIPAGAGDIEINALISLDA